jgi:predicted nucleic acid-binding protein
VKYPGIKKGSVNKAMFLKVGGIQAVSDTGPLISIFQSNSLDILTPLISVFHITPVCRLELSKHGWDHALHIAGTMFKSRRLTAAEENTAISIAHKIALHPTSKDPIAKNHLGEAQAIVLATRTEFSRSVLLIDEKAARIVATDAGLRISGFAGILLGTVQRKLLTAEELRTRLKTCQLLGTHYSDKFIEEVYLMAKGVK